MRCCGRINTKSLSSDYRSYTLLSRFQVGAPTALGRFSSFQREQQQQLPPQRSFSSCPTPASTRPLSRPSPELRRLFERNKVLDVWTSKQATLTTLRHLILFGKQVLAQDRRHSQTHKSRAQKLLLSANFVRNELPVRLAHRIRDLQSLPYAIMTHTQMGDVYRAYWSAFEALRKWPSLTTLDQNRDFCYSLRGMLENHGDLLLPALTDGIVQSSEAHALISPDQIDRFMTRMLRSSISRRILAEQHLALSKSFIDPPDGVPHHVQNGDGDERGQIGIIATSLDMGVIVHQVIARVKRELEGEGCPYPVPNVVVDGDVHTQLACIPEHVEWIVHQLVSNAMRSTMLRPPSQRDNVPIRFTIVQGQGDRDVLLRSSDSGGGLPHVFSPSTSTFSPRSEEGGQPVDVGKTESLGEVEEGQEGSNGAAPASSRNSNPRGHLTVPYHPSTDEEASYLAHRGGGAFHAPEAQRQAKEATRFAPFALSEPDRIATAAAHDQQQRDFAFGDDATPHLARSRAEFLSSSIPRAVGSSGQVQDELVRLFCSFSLVKRRTGRSGGQYGPTPSSFSSLRNQPLDQPAGKSTGVKLRAKGLPGLAHQSHKTGLGLPVTKVYCDFFGGSLALRSLDGHSTDVYVRLPKLGRMRKDDAPEEIVL